MKRRFFILFGGVAIIALAAGIAYPERHAIKDTLAELTKPPLPAAVPFRPASDSSSVVSDQTSPIQGGAATSQHYILTTSPSKTPPSKDPFADTGPLPKEVNLAVPFSSQAPTGNWNQPFQDACEETSLIMVDAYYRGVTGKLPPDEATRAILDLVAFENKLLGEYKDTDAADTVRLMKEYFRYTKAVIVPLIDISQLKRALANGYPVIIPADGKALPNPNFRNGGPIYHMIVAKGYTANKIITNDPGTSKGADFLYSPEDILQSAHDWNGGDVKNGSPLMFVIMPK